MTWLRDLPPGTNEWERVAALAPDAMSALVDVHKVMRSHGDLVILELCRLRIAMLKRSPADLQLRNEEAMRAGLDETKIAALRDWPRSPLFSPAERACLALTEQFVMDVGAMTSELVDAVLEHLSPEDCYGLVNALWVFEAMQSLGQALGVAPDPQSLALTTAAPIEPVRS
jgi:alkylhydroperoxidase family enzyme